MTGEMRNSLQRKIGDYNRLRKQKSTLDTSFQKEYAMMHLVQSIQNQEHHEVYIAQNQKTGEKVCVKKIHKQRLQRKSLLQQSLQKSEVTMVQRVEHPKIIKVYEVKESENYTYLVFEYCELGTLKQHMLKYNGYTV